MLAKSESIPYQKLTTVARRLARWGLVYLFEEQGKLYVPDDQANYLIDIIQGRRSGRKEILRAAVRRLVK